jgi:hypothetical protein
MDEPQSFPLWLIPIFPLFFAAMWLGITGALAGIGGWSELARLFHEPEGTVRAPVQRFGMTSLDLRRGSFPLPTNYSNCAIVEIANAGIHLRLWMPFRFRHPPLLIPWKQIGQLEPGTLFFWHIVTLHPRATAVRIRMYGAAAHAVEDGWRQFTAHRAAAELART